jgi:hypothetical protein
MLQNRWPWSRVLWVRLLTAFRDFGGRGMSMRWPSALTRMMFASRVPNTGSCRRLAATTAVVGCETAAREAYVVAGEDGGEGGSMERRLAGPATWRGLTFVAPAVGSPVGLMGLLRKTASMAVDWKGRSLYSLPVWNDLTSVTFFTTASLWAYFSSVRT